MRGDLREVAGGIRSRIDRGVTVVQRTGPVPLLVRGTLFATALISLVVAWPAELALGRAGLVLFVFALLPAVAPGSRLVSLTIGWAVVGWLVRTTSYAEPITYWRLAALAGLLYLVHTLAALAAVLPYDAVVDRNALVPWLRDAALVIVATAVAALFALLVPVFLGDRRYLAASLVGLALVIAFATGLALLLHRRGDRGHRNSDSAGGVPDHR